MRRGGGGGRRWIRLCETNDAPRNDKCVVSMEKWQPRPKTTSWKEWARGERVRWQVAAKNVCVAERWGTHRIRFYKSGNNV